MKNCIVSNFVNFGRWGSKIFIWLTLFCDLILWWVYIPIFIIFGISIENYLKRSIIDLGSFARNTTCRAITAADGLHCDSLPAHRTLVTASMGISGTAHSCRALTFPKWESGIPYLCPRVSAIGQKRQREIGGSHLHSQHPASSMCYLYGQLLCRKWKWKHPCNKKKPIVQLRTLCFLASFRCCYLHDVVAYLLNISREHTMNEASCGCLEHTIE